MKWPLQITMRGIVLAILVTSFYSSILLIGTASVYALHKQNEIAAQSHKHFGDDFTFAWERRLDPILDKFKRTKFELIGGDTRPEEINPEGYVYAGGRVYGPAVPPPEPEHVSLKEVIPQEVVPEVVKAPAWAPPPTAPFQPERNADEGIWSFKGLPQP